MKTFILSIFIFCLPFYFNAQILNAGMETYTYTTSDTLPTNWMVKSNYGSVRGQTTDAHSGNYAFVINSWYYYGFDMLVNGNIDHNDLSYQWIKAGCAVSGKPDKLKGFYKYTETKQTDSAIVEVILKKWNPIKNKPDTIAYGDGRLHPTETYIEFEVAIKDFSVGVQPDSVVIKFTSHDPKNINSLPNNANSRYLYVDDLSLSQPVGIKESQKDKSVSCFYSDNEIKIINKENKGFTLNIFTNNGKLIFSKYVSDAEEKINVGYFQKGIYLIATSGEVNINQKFLKE